MKMNQNSKAKAVPIHQCEYCQKQFSNKYKLSDHRKIHLHKPDFKCSFCGYETYHKVALEIHIRSHTKERPYKCDHPDCTANFTQKWYLSQHQRLHSKEGEKMLKCFNCSYKTAFESSLSGHLKTHFDVKEFSCDLCPYQAKQKGSLKIHHEVVHLKSKPFKCEQPNCDFACTKKSQLNHHQLVHANEEEKEKLLKYKCDQCLYKTTIKGRLTRHLLQTHSSVKKFSCDLCPFRSKHARSVESHKKYVHPKSPLRPFKCPQPNCNYSGKTRSDLSQHMKVHIIYKEFACSYPPCDYKTNLKNYLKTHEMTHRGEKPFKCTLCSFTSTHKKSLDFHIRRHTGEAPYPCPNCSYRGKNSSSLTQHLKRCKLGENQAKGSLK